MSRRCRNEGCRNEGCRNEGWRNEGVLSVILYFMFQ